MDTKFGTDLMDLAKRPPYLTKEWERLRRSDLIRSNPHSHLKGYVQGLPFECPCLQVGSQLGLGLFAVTFMQEYTLEGVVQPRWLHISLESSSRAIVLRLEEDDIPKDENKLFELLLQEAWDCGKGNGVVWRNRDIILLAWRHLVSLCSVVPEIENIDAIYNVDA
jgi:hypothetical protein